MSQPGWYPDPGGVPGRYRYWDGRRWSDETSSRPGGISGRRRNPAVLIAVLAVVAVVVAALTVRFLLTPADRTTDDPLPSSTVTGGDDRSPTPVPSSATPTPSLEPSGLEDCPVGNPNARADHPNDPVFVYGGNLTITDVGEFEAPGEEPRMSFAWDVTEQIHVVSTQPGWIAQFARPAPGQRRVHRFGTSGGGEGPAVHGDLADVHPVRSGVDDHATTGPYGLGPRRLRGPGDGRGEQAWAPVRR